MNCWASAPALEKTDTAATAAAINFAFMRIDLLLFFAVRSGCRRPAVHASARSLKRHVEAFRNVRAEAGRDDDAAAYLQCGIVAGPHRIAARTEGRIGVRRLGFGGVER